jgi:lactate dehydrogenase-like 2-hydroxyacid dehydrogenase
VAAWVPRHVTRRGGHQGSVTVETHRAMGDLVLQNLAAYFAGETLPTWVIQLPREGTG